MLPYFTMVSCLGAKPCFTAIPYLAAAAAAVRAGVIACLFLEVRKQESSWFFVDHL